MNTLTFKCLEKEFTEVENTMGDIDLKILGDFNSGIGGVLTGLELENINNRKSKETAFIRLVHILSINFFYMHTGTLLFN
jgi:hypothetical protein